jgi:hypothetical protein
MGPFETIDLNAPGGVADYCERYGETITNTCKEMCDARAMKDSETARVVDASMRARVPAADLSVKDCPLPHAWGVRVFGLHTGLVGDGGRLQSGKRRAWRDARLAALAVHKRTMLEVGTVVASTQFSGHRY